jgi:hypothetical protein
MIIAKTKKFFKKVTLFLCYFLMTQSVSAEGVTLTFQSAIYKDQQGLIMKTLRSPQKYSNLFFVYVKKSPGYSDAMYDVFRKKVEKTFFVKAPDSDATTTVLVKSPQMLFNNETVNILVGSNGCDKDLSKEDVLALLLAAPNTIFLYNKVNYYKYPSVGESLFKNISEDKSPPANLKEANSLYGRVFFIPSGQLGVIYDGDVDNSLGTVTVDFLPTYVRPSGWSDSLCLLSLDAITSHDTNFTFAKKVLIDDQVKLNTFVVHEFLAKYIKPSPSSPNSIRSDDDPIVKSNQNVQASTTCMIDNQKFKTVGPGMTSDLIKRLQVRLKELKYFNAVPNGYYGKATVKSVKDFQIAKQIPATGNVGLKTINALNTLCK